MRIVTDLFQDSIEIKDGETVSLIVENPKVHLALLKKIENLIAGIESGIIFSEDNEIIKASKKVELLNLFPTFDLNEKRLLSKLLVHLEEVSNNEKFYCSSMELVCNVKNFIFDISEDISYGISCSNLSIGTIIKACGIQVEDDSESDLERILLYMEMVRELLGEKLFIMTNMKMYFEKKEISEFAKMVSMRKYKVLLIDGFEGEPIEEIKRVIVDKDLCVI